MKIFYIKRIINLITYKIVTNQLYSKITLITIVSNSIVYAIEPHYSKDWPEIEFFFILYYCSELLMKLNAFGFYKKGLGYFGQKSNVMDFFILAMTIFSNFFEKNSDIDFGPLRILRIFKVLEIDEMKNVIKGIFFSLKLVLETILIFSIFICVGALISFQSFFGLLRRRCFQEDLGKPHPSQILCGNKTCPEGFICGDLLENIENGASHFDNFLSSFIQVFRVLNLNSWFGLMNNIQRTFTDFVWIFFMGVIFFGNFFLLNLLLAVLKVKYCEFRNNVRDTKEKEDNPYKLKRMSFSLAVNKKLYIPKLVKKAKGFAIRRDARNAKRESTFFAQLKSKLQDSGADMPSDLMKMFDKEKEGREEDRKTSIDSGVPKSPRRNTRKFSTIKLPKISKLGIFVQKIKKLIKKYSAPAETPIREDYLTIRVRSELEYHMNSRLNVLPSQDENLFENKFRKIMQLRAGLRTKLFYNKETFLKEKQLIRASSPRQTIIRKQGKRFKNKSSSKNAKMIKPCYRIPVKRPKKQLDFEELEKGEALEKSIKRAFSLFRVQDEKKSLWDSIKKNLRNLFFILFPGRRKKENANKVLPALSFRPSLNRSFSPSKRGRKSKLNSPRKLRSTQPEASDQEAKIIEVNLGPIEMQLPGVSPFEMKELIEELKAHEIENDEKPSHDQESEDFLQEYQSEYLSCLASENNGNTLVVEQNIWSGTEVLVCPLKNSYTLNIFKDLNTIKTNAWLPGFHGIFYQIRYLLQSLYHTKSFNQFHIILLTINTFFVSEEDPLSEDGSMSKFNIIIYAYFLLEIILKVMAFGFSAFFKTKLNIIDFISVGYFYFRIFIHFVDKDFMNKYSSIRFLHTLSVLRFLRVLSLLTYMKIIQYIIKKTFMSFIYIAFILSLFVLMYALFGLRVFQERIDTNTLGGQQRNFQEFSSAFRTSFNIITVDNWYDVYSSTYKTADRIKVIAFLMSLIFLGNYVMVNLFIAILLDGFEGMEEANAEGKDKNSNFLPDESDDDEEDNMLEKQVKSLENSLIKKIKTMNKSRRDSSAGMAALDNPKEEDHLITKSKKAKTFIVIGCKYSLFLFSKNDKARIFFSKIIQSNFFENLVTFFVAASCIHLAADSSGAFQYGNNKNEWLIFAFKFSGNILDMFYTLEACLKIVALGFYFGTDTYLKTFFGIIDLLVLVGIYINLILRTDDVTFFKLTLILKMIRPLKLILKFKKMKVMLISMISSLYGLFNVAIVLTFIWLTFAIIGMTLFKDRSGYCDSPINFGIGRDDCQHPLQWKIYPYNFNSIPEALLTLLAVSTFDNWMAHISIAVNSNLAKYGPTELNNRWSANFFFMSFIVVGVWFMLNLIVGVLFSNFLKAQTGRKTQLLTENQLKWIEMHNKILSEQPSLIKYPKSGIRKIIWNIIKSKVFKRITLLTLILNFFSIALFSPESPEDMRKIYKVLETYIELFYIIEGLLKLFAFRLLGYLSNKRRHMELISVTVSVFNMTTKFLYADVFDRIPNGDVFQRVFFALQIIPQIRLFMKIKNLKKLIHTISFSLPMIINVMALFLLVMFVYSLIGIILFKDVIKGEVIDDYVNFKNIFFAFMTLFKSCSGDQWVNILVDTRKTLPNCVPNYDCGSAFSPMFFASFIILIRYIFFNMFILILVQNFENFHKNPLNPIPIFKDNIKRFKKGWGLYCEDNQDNKIHSNKIVDFLKFIGEPLGVKKDSNFLEFGRKIMLMEMKCDEDDFIYFREFLYSAMKGYFRDEGFFDNMSEEAEKILDSKEKKFFKKLRTEKEKFSVLTFFGKFARKKGSKISIVKPTTKQINPLYAYLNKLILFKVWGKFTDHIMNNKMTKEEIFQITEESSDEDEDGEFDDEEDEESEQKSIDSV